MTDASRPDMLDALGKRLANAAVARDLTCTPFPEIVGTAFRGGEAAGAASIRPSELPLASRGLRIGRYSVVLGLLAETATLNAVRETVRRYRNQCVIARSYLSANEALDLQLVLMGPRGSEASPDWQALALMVERDDRVARKLAWLRPEDPVNDDASFEDFLGRTFLSRPWSNAAALDPAALDRLSSSEPIGTGVPRNTAEAWEAIALGAEEDPVKVVNALVDAWAKRNAA